MITLTAEHIEQIRTPAGGFNMETMGALGVPWPLKSGWQDQLIGRAVSNKAWKDAQKASLRKRRIFRGNTRSRP